MQSGVSSGKKAARGSQKTQPDKSQKSLRSFFEPSGKGERDADQLKRKRPEELEGKDR